MTTYAIDVYRDDKFWMIRVPNLDEMHGLVGEAITQARRIEDVETEARDYICTVIDAAPSAVDVVVRSTMIDGTDVLAAARQVHADRERAQEMERAAAAQFAELAQNLASHTVPVRDIGSILGVSYQRAHQLTGGAAAASAPVKVPAKKVAKVAPAAVKKTAASAKGVTAKKTAGSPKGMTSKKAAGSLRGAATKSTPARKSVRS